MAFSNPLAAYLAGEATEDQLNIIESWVAASPENLNLLERLSQSWEDQQLDLHDLPFPVIYELEEEEELMEED